MEYKILSFLLLSLLFPSSIYSQNTWNVNCVFAVIGTNYDCNLNAVFVPNDENVVVVFGGVHQPGQNAQSVSRIMISASNVPFIIRQAFTSFPNLRVYSDSNAVTASIMRIQENAIQGANNLHEVIATNANINTLFSSSFQGAAQLRTINLQNNQLTTIPNGLLNNLVNLEQINLSGNRLVDLPTNFFQPAAALTHIFISNNLFTQLATGFIPSSNRVTEFHAANNQINGIARRFLDNLPALVSLNLVANACVNQNFVGIGTILPIQTVHQQLEGCYDNYGGNVEPRNYTMNLRGSMTVWREDGTLVGRL